MQYIILTRKTPAQAAVDLQVAAKQHGFGVLHSYNLKEILTAKGFPQTRECLIFEVCHPRQADRVLGEDFRMNLALPCRISVWEEKQGTQIGMILPQALLAQLSDSPGLRAIAAEVEADMKRIIDEAK